MTYDPLAMLASSALALLAIDSTPHPASPLRRRLHPLHPAPLAPCTTGFSARYTPSEGELSTPKPGLTMLQTFNSRKPLVGNVALPKITYKTNNFQQPIITRSFFININIQ